MTNQRQDTSELVREFSDKLFRFFRSHGIAYAEAQDLVQETFRVFLEKDLAAVQSRSAFLWGIARKKLLQARTRPRTYEEYRSSLGPEALTSLSTQADRGLRIQSLLMQLEEEDRTIFIMRCEGQTVDEIVESTALNRSKVKRSLAATRERIDELDKDGTMSADAVADHYREV